MSKIDTVFAASLALSFGLMMFMFGHAVGRLDMYDRLYGDEIECKLTADALVSEAMELPAGKKAP